MREHQRTAREAEELDSVEEEELAQYLEEIAPHIGWIIIFFNSLEDGVARCLRELMLRDSIQDERLDVFLSEMLFAAKCRALIHLYGQTLEDGVVELAHSDLDELDALLTECGKRRNEYAHGDWIGLRQGHVVKVKSQSKKRGIVHRYKRFDPSDLREDEAFVAAARDKLDDFHERLLDQLLGRT